MQVFLEAGCEALPISFPSTKMLVPYIKRLLVQKLTINSLQKATPSSNKFTNVQETVDELDSCHEGRYNIEVTKLKIVTML